MEKLETIFMILILICISILALLSIFVWHNMVTTIIFIIAIVSLLVFVVSLCLKSDREKAERGESLSESFPRLEKRDIYILLAFFLVALALSFYKLGDMKAASNYWKASSRGEYVIVEFDQSYDVRKLAYSCNIPTNASYKVYYEDEEGDYQKVFK